MSIAQQMAVIGLLYMIQFAAMALIWLYVTGETTDACC